jgi:hypothetical protein
MQQQYQQQQQHQNRQHPALSLLLAARQAGAQTTAATADAGAASSTTPGQQEHGQQGAAVPGRVNLAGTSGITMDLLDGLLLQLMGASRSRPTARAVIDALPRLIVPPAAASSGTNSSSGCYGQDEPESQQPKSQSSLQPLDPTQLHKEQQQQQQNIEEQHKSDSQHQQQQQEEDKQQQQQSGMFLQPAEQLQQISSLPDEAEQLQGHAAVNAVACSNEPAIPPAAGQLAGQTATAATAEPEIAAAVAPADSSAAAAAAAAFCSAGEPCTVCHEEFVAGRQVVALPCRHCFHEACLLPWLGEVSWRVLLILMLEGCSAVQCRCADMAGGQRLVGISWCC